MKDMTSGIERIVPRAFVWRRLHSLLGFWLVLYLFIHLLTNSQAALWVGDDGIGFVRLVNSLESLPYLQVVEILLIGIPLLLHGVLGIKYALSGKFNAHKTNGAKPSLSNFSRNHAYVWQRVTSWILLVGILGHVVQMRFMDYPKEVFYKGHHEFMVRLNFDKGLYTVSQKQGVTLFTKDEIDSLDITKTIPKNILSKEQSLWKSSKATPYDPNTQEYADELLSKKEKQEWIETLKSFSLKPTQVIAVASSPGIAMLLSVRDTFKSPLMIALYSIFVLAACFHAFNGLWTCLITWGALLSFKSQRFMVSVTTIIMLTVIFLGLAAVWGTYWVNLRY